MCMEIFEPYRQCQRTRGMTAQEEAGRKARRVVILGAVWFLAEVRSRRGEKAGVHQRSVDFIHKVEI